MNRRQEYKLQLGFTLAISKAKLKLVLLTPVAKSFDYVKTAPS
jgi:hypothetical protein